MTHNNDTGQLTCKHGVNLLTHSCDVCSVATPLPPVLVEIAVDGRKTYSPIRYDKDALAKLPRWGGTMHENYHQATRRPKRPRLTTKVARGLAALVHDLDAIHALGRGKLSRAVWEDRKAAADYVSLLAIWHRLTKL